MADVVPSPDLAPTLDALRRAYLLARAAQVAGLVAIAGAMALAPRALFKDPLMVPFFAFGLVAAWFGWVWDRYRRAYKAALVAPVVAALPLDDAPTFSTDFANAKAWVLRTGFFKGVRGAAKAQGLRTDDMVEGRLAGRKLAWCDIGLAFPSFAGARGRALDGRLYWRELGGPPVGRVEVWPAGEAPSVASTGDRAFEARYSVVGGDPAAVAQVLTPERRAALLAFPPRPVKLAFDGGWLAMWTGGRPADMEPGHGAPAHDARAVAAAQDALRAELTAAIALVAALAP